MKPHCRLCKKPFTKEELDAKLRAKGEKIRAGIKRRYDAGLTFGGRRKINHDEIKKLWAEGLLKKKEIAERVGCSKSLVDHVVYEREYRK